MTTILAVALCAVPAGARSFAAMGEWAANASPQVLSALGAGQRVQRGRGRRRLVDAELGR